MARRTSALHSRVNNTSQAMVLLLMLGGCDFTFELLSLVEAKKSSRVFYSVLQKKLIKCLIARTPVI